MEKYAMAPEQLWAVAQRIPQVDKRSRIPHKLPYGLVQVTTAPRFYWSAAVKLARIYSASIQPS